MHTFLPLTGSETFENKLGVGVPGSKVLVERFGAHWGGGVGALCPRPEDSILTRSRGGAGVAQSQMPSLSSGTVLYATLTCEEQTDWTVLVQCSTCPLDHPDTAAYLPERAVWVSL